NLERPTVSRIPIGSEENGEIYRIVPGAFEPVSEPTKLTTDRKVVSGDVLGINLNVHPQIPSTRREGNLSEQSAISNDSIDSDGTGFVFHQLGAVEVWANDPSALKSNEDAGSGPWLSTAFIAVVKFKKSGIADGSYLVYNFYPRNYQRERYGRRESEQWGYLSPQSRLSFARLADKIGDLKFADIQFDRDD
ncbi:MAG: hypothetical protein MMC33_002944, partial [Icmadophila ericetorum]|nr:hypothetical protein [Icmadophila ericetorum]